MAVASTLTITLRGVTGLPVKVEADLSQGLPGLAFTGLAGTAVTEARDRIRAAVLNSGVEWPNRRITVALLPADVRKSGSQLDLAMALAVLAAAGTVEPGLVARTVWLAELGLDGALRPVRGVLPAVVAAREAGARLVVVAARNAAEAALVGGIEIRSADCLRDVVAALDGGAALPVAEPVPAASAGPAVPDLCDVAGQATARTALELAAAGGHHLFLQGVPGAGKTMLMERLPGILPPLDDAAALELTAVHSVAGRLGAESGLLRHAPFEAPHHAASLSSLVGGGAGLAVPGAISLAHHGVLFLDEAPQFDTRVLDALRQPLESGRITVYRSGGAVTYPARFLLALAANPCPCARPGDRCRCAPLMRRRYEERLSGPLLDRVDIKLWVDPVTRADLFGETAAGVPPESSAVVAARVRQARAVAAERWAALGWRTNSDAAGSTLRRRPWRPAPAVLRDVERALDTGRLTARGFDRVLRLAWTCADVAGHGSPRADDVAAALFYRLGRDQVWAA